MQDITGKTLVFTDLHIGLAGNKESRLKMCIEVIKQVIKAVKAEKISNVLFCGDWHHSRTSLDSNALNISYKLVTALGKCARCILICGNHDIYLKNSTDINSINIFKDIPNVELVTKTQQLQINGKKCLLVPWLGDLNYSKETFDFMFGHFDISSRYLVSSYVEEHSKLKACSEKSSKDIESDSMLSNASKTNDMVGDFVELAKKNGYVFAGHIHQHKEMMSKGRKFIFIGSPCQQTLGDIGCSCGYYVIDEDGNCKFAELSSLPKHVQIMMSDIDQQGIDNYDFSIVKNNIVQKVYDIEVPAKTDAIVSQKISDFKPYEELTSDYQVKLDMKDADINDQSSAIAMMKKSKLDYVKHYIDNIDSKVLEENAIEKDKLFKVMSEYYSKAIGE